MTIEIKNLNIPDLMRAYMYAYGYRETAKAKELVSGLEYGVDQCRNG